MIFIEFVYLKVKEFIMENIDINYFKNWFKYVLVCD